MITRKSVANLSEEERKAFVDALLAVKAAGKYDKFVHWHHEVMAPAVLPDEPHDSFYRNGAHRGPAFLPWHRQFLMELEGELRAVDPDVSIPYWDWSADAADPTGSVIWSDDFMGGDGVRSDEWRVATGPFAHTNGHWPVPDHGEEGLPGPGLKRMFGVVLQPSSLPTREDVALARAETFYDTPPYSPGPFTTGFRNRIEGFVTQRGDSRVTTRGSQLHNRVHVWVGGNMLLMTSPDDPVFFLHHCFIDKVWADWQERQQADNPEGAPHYAPLQEGPPGHNIDDAMKPWSVTVRDVLDIEALGYAYEGGVSDVRARPQADHVARLRRHSPFWTE